MSRAQEARRPDAGSLEPRPACRAPEAGAVSVGDVETLLDGRYRLGPVLGSGGMGTVHRARDERLRRDVAVKVLREGAGTVEAERLRREARFLAGLQHPNLVEVLDAGADGTRTWFAMELVEGHDLRRDLETNGPLPAAAVRSMLTGAASALGALHEAGVVHRDLKPANVLLADDGTVKVADLGIAQLLRSDRLTETGQVMGTVAYLSPEQVAGRPVGVASDVYSLGLVVLEALTGRVAFDGPVAEAAAVRLARGPAIPRWIGGPWRELLESMTALDPDERPIARRIVVIAASLPDLPPMPASEHVVDDAVTTALPVATRMMPVASPRRRSRLLVSAVSVAAGLLLAGGGFALLNPGAPTAEKAAAAPVSPSAPAKHSATPHPSVTPSSTPKTVAPAAKASAPAAPRAKSVDQRRERFLKALERARKHLRHLDPGLTLPGPLHP